MLPVIYPALAKEMKEKREGYSLTYAQALSYPFAERRDRETYLFGLTSGEEGVTFSRQNLDGGILPAICRKGASGSILVLSMVRSN